MNQSEELWIVSVDIMQEGMHFPLMMVQHGLDLDYTPDQVLPRAAAFEIPG